MHHVGRLRQTRRQDIGEIGELWLNMFLRLKQRMCVGQCGNGSRVVFLQSLKRSMGPIQQRLRVR